MSDGDGRRRIPGMNLIILDADGVFMSEMPYWQTALAAAMDLHGLQPGGEVEWIELARACLVRRSLQSVTKRHGFNSNWDFAAVAARAMDSESVRSSVRAALGRSDFDTCVDMLETQMESLWADKADGRSPLEGFGIKRPGAHFDRVVERFQDIFRGDRDLGWRFEKHALIKPADRTRNSVRRLRDTGATLAVCTSRTRAETVVPMEMFAVASFFDPDRIVTHDDVRRAQDSTGIKPLGKPHWFPLAAAACGFEPAVTALLDGRSALTFSEVDTLVYVGDAPADFIVAANCRQRGLPVRYIHVESGITSDLQRQEISASSMTLAMVDDLAGVVSEVLAWSA